MSEQERHTTPAQPSDQRVALPEVEDIVDWLLERCDFGEGPSVRSMRGAIVAAYERGLAARSETLLTNAAPQPSTAIPGTAPSKEGVGQRDAAAAAPSDDKVDVCTAGLYRLAKECGWSEASSRPPELYIRDKFNVAPSAVAPMRPEERTDTLAKAEKIRQGYMPDDREEMSDLLIDFAHALKAPQSATLPPIPTKRKNEDRSDWYGSGYVDGWNACVDRMAQRNR